MKNHQTENCHFDERSEEKSYSEASFKLKVSSLKLTKSLLTEVGTAGFLASLEMTKGGEMTESVNDREMFNLQGLSLKED